MIDKQNLFDQLIQNDLRTYGNIRKIVTGKEMIILLVVYYIILISKNITS